MKNTIIAAKIRFRGSKTFKSIKSKIDSLETTIAGIKFNVHPMDWSYWQTTHNGTWEPETISIFRENLNEKTRYCDIGGWVGPTALLASALGANVTCFEPDPNAYERLLHNIRINKSANIQTFQIALAGVDGIRRIVPLGKSLGQSSSSIHIVPSGKESAGVLSLSWNTACGLLKLPDFDFIKIDIEGGEMDLLPSMMDYIGEHRPKIFLSTHLPFIAHESKEVYLKILSDLWKLYPGAPEFDINELGNSFPSYLLE